jgi:hypothetical protein
MKELVAGDRKDNKVYPLYWPVVTKNETECWESTISIPKYTTRLQDWVALCFEE